MSDTIVICDNLVKIYKIANLEVVALQGLDLVVKRGEVLGIVGASGSGKSSLMNILGGLDRPTAGRVWVDGQDLLKLSGRGLDYYRRAKVGFVWQQGSRNLVPYLTARENVMLPMTLAGLVGARKRRRADELLEGVGLADRRQHYLAQMSGGEQQRVAIAVALCNNPTLLLADEPTGEVDSATALTIYQTMRKLTEQFGVTTIVVSHDPGIAYHADRVIAIRDGRTASETVRQGVEAPVRDTPGPIIASEGIHRTQYFDELVVVDSVGRLQLPEEYLRRLNIKGRVLLELRENELAIRPAAAETETPEAGRLVHELTTAARVHRGPRWWLHLRRRSVRQPGEDARAE